MKYTNPLDIPKNICGIYQIVKAGEIDWENNDLGDRYIGSAKNIRKRLQKHYSLLKVGKHFNSHLQLAWNKYGEENFYISLIQKANEKYRFIIEEMHIAIAKKSYKLYNKADKTLFVKLTKEQIQKVIDSKKKPITCMDINGNYQCEYGCITDAAIEIKASTTNISKVCNGLENNKFRYSCKGKLFCYKEEYDPQVQYEYIKEFNIDRNPQIKATSKPVWQYDANWVWMKEWPSASVASRAIGLHESAVGAGCKTPKYKVGGYHWAWKNQ